MSINSSTIHYDLDLINQLVFKPAALELINLEQEKESQEYFAHRFQLNGKKILFRAAKITPTKTGQFVTIWKRNDKGITTPFDISDDFDFYIIATKTANSFGLFIFPKQILLEKGILSDETKDGKRGIRVYPAWDITSSKQAAKTKEWQQQYFLDLSDVTAIDVKAMKAVFG